MSKILYVAGIETSSALERKRDLILLAPTMLFGSSRPCNPARRALGAADAHAFLRARRCPHPTCEPLGLIAEMRRRALEICSRRGRGAAPPHTPPNGVVGGPPRPGKQAQRRARPRGSPPR